MVSAHPFYLFPAAGVIMNCVGKIKVQSVVLFVKDTIECQSAFQNGVWNYPTVFSDDELLPTQGEIYRNTAE